MSYLSAFISALSLIQDERGCFIEYLLDRADVKDSWRQFTEHEFVNRMADGTLALEAFKYYLVQDYLYLVQFARANALAAYKAKSMDDITMVIIIQS